MRKNLSTIATALMLAGAATIADRATAAEMVTLNNQASAFVAHMTPISVLPSTNTLHLAISLPWRNQQDLTNLLQAMYDPASTNYHKYLTTDEFTTRFGPTEHDYQSVIAFAQAHGLSVTATYPNRMILDVQGKASDVESAFHVELQTYHHPAENRDFYAPNVGPTIPSTLPILDITGLDNLRQPHTNYRLKPGAATKVLAKAESTQTKAAPADTDGTGVGGSYVGNDFRNAYVPGSPLTGEGQTVALVQFDGYLTSDINEYEQRYQRTNIPLQNILIDGFTGVPTSNNGGGEVEVSLDIEMLVSMAPGLSKIMVYEGNPFNFIPEDVLNRIATDNAARQVSSSWSWGGGPDLAANNAFLEMALQGQTVYFANGDQDAFTAGAGSTNGVDNPTIPHAPVDSPYITAVGGTTLTMNGAGVSYSSETVWNWDVRYGSVADGIGTCGGYSSFYSIPSWQTNINMAARQGSSQFRNMPDIALTGDDVLVIADGGTFYPGTGGTSCAAPLWAAFTALINQQATNNSLPPMGFINPALYALAATTNYNNYFHDITTGNNTWSGSPNLFFATAGYDLCTGLGTPNGTNLINALAAPNPTATNTITHLSAPPAPYGTTLSALNGGNPNGNWELFIQDIIASPNSGVIANGWYVSITSANPVGAAADQALTMTSPLSSVGLNGEVTYSITVTNYGPSDSTNVIVSDNLPANFAYVSADATLGTVDHLGGTVIWAVGDLATNAGAELTLTLQATTIGSFANVATVNADTSDPNPSDNIASVTVAVSNQTPPQLSVTPNISNGAFEFTVNGQAGQQYIIQASTNLVNWTPIYTNQAPYPTPFNFTDPNESSYSYRFFRVVTP